MKTLVFIITILVTSFAEAKTSYLKEAPFEFMIEFKDCYTILNPLIFRPMYGQLVGPKKMDCTKSDKFIFCSIISSGRYEGDFLYKEVKGKDMPPGHLEFGTPDGSEKIIISNRIATYSKQKKEDSFVYSNTCQGIYTTEEALDELKVIDLNKGFKSFIKDL